MEIFGYLNRRVCVSVCVSLIWTVAMLQWHLEKQELIAKAKELLADYKPFP